MNDTNHKRLSMLRSKGAGAEHQRRPGSRYRHPIRRPQITRAQSRRTALRLCGPLFSPGLCGPLFRRAWQDRFGYLASRQLLSSVDVDSADVTVITSDKEELAPPRSTVVTASVSASGLRSGFVAIPVSIDAFEQHWK